MPAAIESGAMDLGMTADDIYENTMQIAWKFSDDIADPKLEDLYRRAKQNQWDSDEQLDWDQPVDPSRPMVNEEQSVYSRMPFFQKLSKSQQETFHAQSTAQLLSQFLHGEQGALLTAASVAHSVPDRCAKLYAATQAMDEARHVEVYAKYIDKIAIAYPISPFLKEVIDVTLRSGRFEKIMIGMNMVVEGLALGAFNNMYRQTTCPLLKDITFNVMRDEARHVSFGHTYLGPLIQKMNDDDREDLAQFAFEAINLIIAAERKGGGYGTAANRFDPGFLRVLEACQIDAEDFFAGMSEAAELGITTELPPGHVLAVKQFMMPAMVRVGLVTERTAKLFEEAGIRVNTDTAVLNAMEDAKSDQNVLHEESTTY
ncbi:MAG: ferritin-like domain-containing protein [Gammaproteobacteria bacterium]|jgi:ribonucleotide reductase beta subunit family protein with ferritin-like domain|nr:ferritin-like domain-containing protein [Gammaproteobacteria bacterium]